MEKITKKGKLILYGCSGLGVNLLNIVMGSYLCSALLVGGFDKNVEHWTFLNKDLVVASLWAILAAIAKIVDGLIDLPFSHFTDNLKSKWGKRKTAIVIGAVPMLIAYILFLFPLNSGISVLNTIWFAALLMIFYACFELSDFLIAKLLF
jgi:Na+/melibiose symporter-like transporter